MKRNHAHFTRLIALLLLIVTGCAPATTPAAPAAAPVTPSAATFPLTIVDDLGRTVTVESAPERIVSLLPSNTEILFAVGAGEQVIGVTSFCNYPAEAATREQIGGITNQTISIEAITALEPDLVVASGTQTDAIQTLTETGLVVIVLEPSTLADIYANIELVGRITAHSDQAAGLVADMQRRAEAVTSKVAAVPEAERPSIYYEVWNEPLMTAGPNTFIGQLVTLAGGRLIFSDVAEDWPQVSAEVIIERDPAVILGPDSNSEILTGEQIAARPGWAQIAAVQSGRIYLLDGDIVSRPGPRIVDALEAMARNFYPDLFE
jgi:iron complex transport system substrate-binding protein